MNPLGTLRKHGVGGTAALYWSELCYRYARFRTRSVPQYRNPNPAEALAIEAELSGMGVPGGELRVDPAEFRAFMTRLPFPPDYHGGRETGHWHEKIFEHFASFKLLNLEAYGPGDSYLDVAAGGSPWVRMLRETRGIDAYAVDLAVRPPVRGLPYYLEQDATNSSFAPASLRGISLHCAYEMFTGDSDIRALAEFGRILKPGGAVVIVPLYLHTHHCCYSSPEHWGKGVGDPGAVEYVRRESRSIPSSRKYDPPKLKERVLQPAQRAGLEPYIHYLRGEGELSSEIYCRFILELRKPLAPLEGSKEVSR